MHFLFLFLSVFCKVFSLGFPINESHVLRKEECTGHKTVLSDFVPKLLRMYRSFLWVVVESWFAIQKFKD
jgi:hypothetical protein